MSMFGPHVIPTALATPQDLATWTENTAPANATALLRSATTLVLDATETAYYAVDTATGLATDPIIITALKEATCIQAATWAAIGYNPLTGGIITATVKGSKKIGSASVTVIGAEAAAASQAGASAALVPEAIRRLRLANLLGDGPYAL